jgi:hypothetical protein
MPTGARKASSRRHETTGCLTQARPDPGAGFADQSHVNRPFKRAYGMISGQWMVLLSGR